MVAEVCLGKVGAVCAREVSRFARNSRDWQQLIEMCRVVDTVLVDQETIYTPRHGNDRLLLGLKGASTSMSLICCASARFRRATRKARRGELVVAAPVGFVKAGSIMRRIRIGVSRKRSSWCSTRSSRSWMDNGGLLCIAFGGFRVDDAIEEALLGVVGPGAIAAAIAAAKEAEERQDQVRDALSRDLEAARCAADRAFR
jgi:hypothetical protein